MDGQIDFNSYFTNPKLDIKPKSLVEFINGMGTAQYTQIGNVIAKTVDYEQYEIDSEIIGRITNNVSVWLLDIGTEYRKYLDKLIAGE